MTLFCLLLLDDVHLLNGYESLDTLQPLLSETSELAYFVKMCPFVRARSF